MSTARRPQDLIFTLYGEFLLQSPPIRVGSLIGLLEPLGLSEGGIRTVLSRMVGRGWLEAEREGRNSYYALTGQGRQLLEEGEARIYRPAHEAEWDGEWTLLAYSIPEEQRWLRDRLRARLSWLGFGSLGNGLWISPHAVVDRVGEIGEELGVAEHLEVFRGRHVGFSARDRLVGQCWDLPAVNVLYESFVERHLPGYRDLRAGASLTPADAYVRRFELVHEFREFPLLDPFLPRALQPKDWAGECSLALFQAYHALLVEPSRRFVESIVEVLPEGKDAAMT